MCLLSFVISFTIHALLFTPSWNDKHKPRLRATKKLDTSCYSRDSRKILVIPDGSVELKSDVAPTLCDWPVKTHAVTQRDSARSEMFADAPSRRTCLSCKRRLEQFLAKRAVCAFSLFLEEIFPSIHMCLTLMQWYIYIYILNYI